MATAASPLRLGIERLDFTVTAFANELGCSRGTLHGVMAGWRPLNPELRARAIELGLSEHEADNLPEPESEPLVLAARAMADGSREGQGLPPTITDVVVLDAVARILASALLQSGPPKPPKRPSAVKRPKAKAAER